MSRSTETLFLFFPELTPFGSLLWVDPTDSLLLRSSNSILLAESFDDLFLSFLFSLLTFFPMNVLVSLVAGGDKDPTDGNGPDSSATPRLALG
jgi:hypothetical protein